MIAWLSRQPSYLGLESSLWRIAPYIGVITIPGVTYDCEGVRRRSDPAPVTRFSASPQLLASWCTRKSPAKKMRRRESRARRAPVAARLPAPELSTDGGRRGKTPGQRGAEAGAGRGPLRLLHWRSPSSPGCRRWARRGCVAAASLERSWARGVARLNHDRRHRSRRPVQTRGRPSGRSIDGLLGGPSLMPRPGQPQVSFVDQCYCSRAVPQSMRRAASRGQPRRQPESLPPCGATGPSRTQRCESKRRRAPKEGTSFKLTFVQGELFDKELLVMALGPRGTVPNTTEETPTRPRREAEGLWAAQDRCQYFH